MRPNKFKGIELRDNLQPLTMESYRTDQTKPTEYFVQLLLDLTYLLIIGKLIIQFSWTSSYKN